MVTVKFAAAAGVRTTAHSRTGTTVLSTLKRQSIPRVLTVPAVSRTSPRSRALFIPRTVAEALSQPDADKWQEAIHVELDAMRKQGVWRVVEIPPGKRAIGSRKVFDCKRPNVVDGVLQPEHSRRYKARLVAQGFTQIPGVDYNLTYAPVCKYATLRAVLAGAAHDDLYLKRFDIKTAFLNSPIEEEVYMKPPFGFDWCKPGQVLRLLKTIYGTKPAGRCFFSGSKTS